MCFSKTRQGLASNLHHAAGEVELDPGMVAAHLLGEPAGGGGGHVGDFVPGRRRRVRVRAVIPSGKLKKALSSTTSGRRAFALGRKAIKP